MLNEIKILINQLIVGLRSTNISYGKLADEISKQSGDECLSQDFTNVTKDIKLAIKKFEGYHHGSKEI